MKIDNRILVGLFWPFVAVTLCWLLVWFAGLNWNDGLAGPIMVGIGLLWIVSVVYIALEQPDLGHTRLWGRDDD